jgi:formamidopyrimidine-DNA glycosylase
MPELPEVTTVVRQLKDKILHKAIKDIIIYDARVIKGISPKKFKNMVKGKTVKDVLRRGKVIVIKLEDNLYLVLHLRISGWIMISQSQEKHVRVIFEFPKNILMNFCDSRVLGHIKLTDDWQNLPLIKSMGPEPLKIKKKEFIELFKNKKAKIKPLLLDQRFIAGIGNIYAQEALFCSGIHPEAIAGKVSPERIAKLHGCMIKILKKAIENKGSSVDSYRPPDGQENNYEKFLKVYGREGDVCNLCKSAIKKKAIGGRGTCFCPKCQKK